MPKSVIPSLAILKVNWDEGRDYIENFVPFVAECIRTAPQPEISVSDLQSAVRDTFGINIPQGALQIILGRVTKHGYVRRTGGIYLRDETKLAKLDFSEVRDTALRQHGALINKLVKFIKEKFGVEWTEEQAESSLLSYLDDDSSGILASLIIGNQTTTTTDSHQRQNFYVASFIAHTCDSDPEGFGYLDTIVKGIMLTEVLHFPDIGSVSRRFNDLDVYFDTPFLLQALGFEGESRRAPRLELVRLLYEENGNLCIFQHTLNEVRSVLASASYAIRNYTNLTHAYGPTIQYFIDSGYTASDVELTIARLEKSLDSLHIKVKARPTPSEEFQIDEQILHSILESEIAYRRPEALYHDLDAIVAIHKLREGQVFLQLESSKAVFVTTNHPLVRGSTRFFRQQYEDYGGTVVPHTLLDHYFTTVVWLKRPQAAPDLPRKRIIADCYAAMRPPDTLWRRYLEEIDKLRSRGDITEDDYALLRLSTPARSALMESTFGDVDAFVEGTIPEILERAQNAAREATEQALLVEKEARSEERYQADRNIASERGARIAAEKRYEAHLESQLTRIRGIGTVVGRWISRCFIVIVGMLLTVGVFLSLFLPNFPGGLWLPIVVLVTAVFVFGTLANLVFGANLVSMSRRLELFVAGLVEHLLRRMSGLWSDED